MLQKSIYCWDYWHFLLPATLRIRAVHQMHFYDRFSALYLLPLPPRTSSLRVGSITSVVEYSKLGSFCLKVIRMKLCFCIFLKWRNADWLATRDHRERRTESKTDSYSKDLLFLASFAFCVITFEPIII